MLPRRVLLLHWPANRVAKATHWAAAVPDQPLPLLDLPVAMPLPPLQPRVAMAVALRPPLPLLGAQVAVVVLYMPQLDVPLPSLPVVAVQGI